MRNQWVTEDPIMIINHVLWESELNSPAEWLLNITLNTAESENMRSHNLVVYGLLAPAVQWQNLPQLLISIQASGVS